MSGRDYVFRLRGEAEQLIAAHERAAVAVDKHADQTALLARQQAVAQAEADRFVAGLKRQAEAIGKNRSELLAMQAAEMGVSDRAAPLIARLQQGEKAAGGFARTGKMTAIELQQVGYQLNDLAVQVASGQNPITALVQQGSQLSGTFGGIRPAMQAVFSLFTPARLAVGGLAVGVGALALAWSQADAENARFSKSLAITGNAAGQTRGSMEALAHSTAENAQITIGASRDIVQALVSTGKVGPKAIEPMAEAIGRVQRLTGESAEGVVKDFASMSAGVARWAAEHNKQYNYLTVEQYRYIRALEAQGKTEEAMAENMRFFNEAVGQRRVELSLLESSWKAVTHAVVGTWDATKRAVSVAVDGNQLGIAEQLKVAEARLEALGQHLGPKAREASEKRIQALRQQLELEKKQAEEQSAQATKNNKAIEAEQQASQAARLAIQKAGDSASRAAMGVALEADRIALERSYEQGTKDLAVYVQERQRIEARGIALKEAAIDQEIALEKRRQGAADSPAEVKQSEARIGELRAQRTALQSERLRLAEDARKEFGMRPAALAAVLDQQKAVSAQRRAEQEVALEGERIALERSYDQGTKDLAAYVEARARLEERAIAIKEAAVEEEIALERRRQAASTSALEAQQFETRIAELEAQKITLQSSRQRLAADAAGNFGGGMALRQLAEQNRQLASSLILDDRKRGLAQIDIEEKVLRERLALQQRNGEERRQVEDEIISWRMLRERELTESLKPEWQRRLEEWEDIERSRKRASDQFNLAFVEGGRQAFGDMLANGRVSFDNLKKFALRSLGEMLYERSGLGRSFASLGDLAFNGITQGLSALLPGVGGGVSPSFAGIGAVPYAKGGTFARSDLAAHRDTIVDKPTLFRFAKGARMGLMGEEGSEAIMPLVRSASGHLGVRAVSSSQASAPHVTVNNYGSDQVETRSEPDGNLIIDIVRRESVKAVAADTARRGMTARATAAVTGANLGSTLRRRRGL